MNAPDAKTNFRNLLGGKPSDGVHHAIEVARRTISERYKENRHHIGSALRTRSWNTSRPAGVRMSSSTEDLFLLNDWKNRESWPST